MEESRGAIRVLVAAECAHLRRGAVEAALAGLNGRAACVTVAAVAAPRPFIAYWAPLTGLVTLEDFEGVAAAEACDAARISAVGLPYDIPVQYRAARCWADALALAEDHDVLVIAARPQRRRDRRAISRA